MGSFVLLGLSWQAWAVIAITVAVFTTALMTKIPTYVIFMGAVTVLLVLGILTPKEGIAGFSSTAVVTAGVLFVIVAGLEKAGVMHWLVDKVLKTPKSHIKGILTIMFPAAFLSSFLSNTSVVSLMINVVRVWCSKVKLRPGQLLIPLSYAAGAGGAFTLIGSPSTLIIADLYAQHEGNSMGFFAPLLPAVCCFLVCVTTVVLLRRLLPKRKVVNEEDMPHEANMQFSIPADSPIVGMSVKEAGMLSFGGARLTELQHWDGETSSPVPADEPIMGGDKLIFQGDMYKLKEEHITYGKNTVIAGLCLVAAIALNLAGVFDLLTSCLIGAIAMLLLKCMSIDDGYNGINWQVLTVWACSIALGKAFETTGVAAAIANGIVKILGTSPLAILLGICFIGTFLTEFVSNTAAAALLFPILVGAVEPLGYNLFPFTVALMVSVTCSFATPIGSPTHLLVYGPGGYTFKDYFKIGLPMNFIVLFANVMSVYLLFF